MLIRSRAARPETEASRVSPLEPTWGGVAQASARSFQTWRNFAEDCIILARFAFGRDYLRKPSA